MAQLDLRIDPPEALNYNSPMVRIFCLIRALLFPVILIPTTMFLATIVIFMVIVRLPQKWADFIVRQIWCRLILILAGVRVIIEGQDCVPKSDGYLYLFSHSSHFDIPVLFSRSPRPFAFGAKIELFSIPFFGPAMKAVGTLPIARDDKAKVIEVYKNAERRVANGEAFALAPEGGRRKTKELAPFKTGPFIFAINAKMPLVPVLIYGADKVLPKKSLLINAQNWRTEIVLKYLPMTSVKGESTQTAKALRDRVREQMVAAYEDLEKRYS